MVADDDGVKGVKVKHNGTKNCNLISRHRDVEGNSSCIVAKSALVVHGVFSSIGLTATGFQRRIGICSSQLAPFSEAQTSLY